MLPARGGSGVANLPPPRLRRSAKKGNPLNRSSYSPVPEDPFETVAERATPHAFPSEVAIREDARLLLGASNWRAAEIYNVYSAGDSGDGCEVIEFTMPSASGRVPWTAKVFVSDGERCVLCSRGWS